MTTRFPALRRVILAVQNPDEFTTDVPSLTALAPHLKEIEFRDIIVSGLPKHGYGFEPRLFAQFVAAIQGVTRVRFGSDSGPSVLAMMSQHENENLGQLTALRTLRDLELSSESIYAKITSADGRWSTEEFPASVADDVITNLPPLPPGLTRLALSGATRAAFGHPLPGLRVLDWRGASTTSMCTLFADEGSPGIRTLWLYAPLAIPSAAIAPNLHTLLIGFAQQPFKDDDRRDFDLWTLVAARTALRVVVIERARLLCSAPDGFETTTAGFAAVLARQAKDLVSIHIHGCDIEGRHEQAVENFFHALEQRGVLVCDDDAEECLFCMLHDGTDLWPRIVVPSYL